MSKDKIKEPCFFRVNQEQMEIIQERFKQSGMDDVEQLKAVSSAMRHEL